MKSERERMTSEREKNGKCERERMKSEREKE